MARDTIVSWKTFAIFVLFPPVAILAIVLFPITLCVILWLYFRGQRQARQAASPSQN
jgi:cbb3-type cytochrome oxidase subunit 3